jgi:hypothetical protein
LCNSHLLRELIAVTETGTSLDKTWAQQAIDALLALKDAAEPARQAGHAAIDQQVRAEHEDWFRKAAATGIALNASRNGKLQQKRHALAIRMQAREDDYLRFARDPRAPFTNNEAENHPDEQAADQDLRLHAVHDRGARVLRDPVLPRHRRPPRHQRPRRPHPRLPGQPLDPRNRITPPGHQSAGQPEPGSRVQGTDLLDHRELAFSG